jgi:hypothetical protein
VASAAPQLAGPAPDLTGHGGAAPLCGLARLRWSDGRQHLVGDGVADSDRLAGRVGFLLCHRTGLCAGNESVPFIAGDRDGIGAVFEVHFQFAFQWLTGAALLTQTEAIDSGTTPDEDKHRRYRTGRRPRGEAAAKPTLNDRLDDLMFAGDPGPPRSTTQIRRMPYSSKRRPPYKGGAERIGNIRNEIGLDEGLDA